MFLLLGCVLSVRPLTSDLSDEDPSTAMELTLDALNESYAFADWKSLELQAIRSTLVPRLDAGEDVGAVFGSLVEALPDGHVILEGHACPEAAGDTGITFAQLDDGTILATSGPLVGEVVTTWNGLDVLDALEVQPLHCSPYGLATHERRRSVQLRLLGRAPAGDMIFVNGSSYLAIDDGDDPRVWLDMEAPQERVSAWMHSPGVGVIELGWEETILSERAMRRELESLWRDGARALVLDLRANDGGTDMTAANIAGLFTNRTWFYETITMYDRRTSQQASISELWVEPQEFRWDGPVAALVDRNTVSSGEGLAMMLARFPEVEVVGFEGTAASFGSSGSTVALPDGLELTFPAGRSLDQDGAIQLDSDHTLTGGVQPTMRIPSTTENVLGRAADPHGFAIDWAVEQALR